MRIRGGGRVEEEEADDGDDFGNKARLQRPRRLGQDDAHRWQATDVKGSYGAQGSFVGKGKELGDAEQKAILHGSRNGWTKAFF